MTFQGNLFAMDKSVPPSAAYILDFIGSKEAPKGYNTVYGNRKMPKLLTTMTFDEVVADGPRRTREYGSSACGRYQFMSATLDAPKTLADLKGEMKLTGNEKFSADLQDRMGLHLLKRRGYDKFVNGTLSATGFGLNLAKEWASFPALKATKGAHRNVSRGQSYYAGDGVNKALVSAADVETVLQHALTLARASVAPPVTTAPVAAPKPVSGGIGGALASMWASLNPKPASAAVIPLNADPIVWNIQTLLKERNYMANGRIDGFDGPKTRDAIAAIRKDNGMGDGGIDDEFLKRLPGFGPRPVSAERVNASTTQAYGMAKEQAPDLTANVGTMWKSGLGSLILGSGGLAQASGALDTVKNAGDKANDVLGTVQTVFATLAGGVQFIVTHWQWFVVAFGIYLLLRAASAALNLVIRIRQARGI